MTRDRTRFFAILMPWGRVGSNLVTMALAASENIEIDNEPATRLSTSGHQEGWSKEMIGARQLEHLSSFHEAHRDAGGAAGLKLSHRSLIAPRDYAECLIELDFLPIIMLRNNFLKCAVSQMRALARVEALRRQRPNWRSPWAVGRTEPKPGPTTIDPTEAIRLTQVFEKHHLALLETSRAAFTRDTIQIEYRQLASNPGATIERLFRALDLSPPKRIRVPHKKATSDLLSQDITNYTEFAEAVHRAGLGHFLAADS